MYSIEEGKRKYGLGCIRVRLERTSESILTLQLLVMNLKTQAASFCIIFPLLFRRCPVLSLS